MPKAFIVPKEGAGTNLTFGEKLKIEWDKYGLIASFIVVFTLLNGFTWWAAAHFIERADRQADANYKIGILEGQMQILLKNRK